MSINPESVIEISPSFTAQYSNTPVPYREQQPAQPMPPIVQRRHDRPEARDARKGADVLDPNKKFFIQVGQDEGGIRMNWRKWRYVRDASSAIVAVDVIYEELRDARGDVISVDKVQLIGNDAYNFLRAMNDRNADAFKRAERQPAPAAGYYLPSRAQA